MKIKLTSSGDIQIFTLTENISEKDIDVLRAGFKNALRNGKNKIILELISVDHLSDDVLRELGIMDNFARELAGRILMVTDQQALRNRIQNFASPPLVFCFESRELAIAQFTQTTRGLDEPESKKEPLFGADPKTDPQALLSVGASDQSLPPVDPALTDPEAVQRAQLQKQKEEILARETAELGQLRKQLAEMQSENKVLHEQLASLIQSRRQFVDNAALQEKISALQMEMEKLMNSKPGAQAAKPVSS
ncbi:MAG: hypothetical protein ACO3A2_04270 [Bdellovibrionia bacterium]